MDPTIKATIHILALLLFGGACVGNKEPWCYDRPHCGPNTWSSLGKCNGKNQSPIDIVTKNAVSDYSLGPIKFSGYEDRKRPSVLKNTGHSSEIEMKDGATISGPGLPAIYALKSFHLHWGTYNHKGSEHAIDGLKHDMELHIVHTKNNMTLEEAKKDPQGFAVLAFFIKKSNKAPSVNTWKTLADLMEKIPEKGNAVKLDGQFSLGGLLKVADTKTYYRYRGSLTTPDCNEAVVWTVYPTPIEVTHKTLKKFTDSLYFTTITEGRKMQKNYRPLQPLNNRKVLYFTENKHGHSYLKHCSDSGKF